MSTFRNPVGPQPGKVYWRRRLIVGLGLLAVIVIIVLIIVRPGSGAPTAAPTTSATPTATPTSTATPGAADDTAAADADACDPDVVTVTAITDASSYDADVDPMLSLSLTNTGKDACSIEAGSDVQEYKITSGEELIWSSKDCQETPVARTQVLEPGKAVASTPFAWDRTRSDPDACDAEREPVTGDGASYHLSVVVDGIESAESKQFLLY
jgi:hypothetical protein